jgi:glycosyltransferase involved in cell wall biosynthesis
MMFEYLAFCVLATGWLAARSIRRPFDVVHVHNPPDFLVVCGAVPRLRGSKVILDIHDLSPHMLSVRVSGPLGNVFARVLVWVERIACGLADHVITVHNPYRRELVHHGVRENKVRVVMNGVDNAVLDRARDEGPCVERSAAFRVAYHGTLTWWYGTDLIVDAVSQLRGSGLDIDAVILGDGDAVEALREQVARFGLERSVHVSGQYVPIEQALATAAQADCGIVPNRPCEINRFALSSKLFEYVALGVPVVVARLQTLAAYFDPEEVTFFEPGDAVSLAEAIAWVNEHPAQARDKALRAQRRADEYSWARGREILLRSYGELAPTNGHLALTNGHASSATA